VRAASQLERRNNVANLGNDYPNDDADPIDSAPPRAAILHHGSTAKERAAANRDHHVGLIANLVENSVAVGHGHLVGSQGFEGHRIPDSSAHLQKGAHLPQGPISQPNRQNLSSDGSGSADFNDPSGDDCGTVDK
jgi:hypothetical protein